MARDDVSCRGCVAFESCVVLRDAVALCRELRRDGACRVQKKQVVTTGWEVVPVPALEVETVQRT